VLRLDDRWVWDFWLARDGDDHHLFFLQADRALVDENRRHVAASIGHAVSSDLTTWEILPDALHPGAPGAWDDLATWTGSVVRHDGSWHLFYSAVGTADSSRVQRVGAAISDDLITWRRHGANPLIAADGRWYDRSVAADDEPWRDPWVFRPPGSADHLALITARASDGRGTIALARSADLAHWTVCPPLYTADAFGELEVPQIVSVDGRWFLVFSVPAHAHGGGGSAVFHVAGDGPTGPFAGRPEPFPAVVSGAELYAGRLVEHAEGSWWYLATRVRDGDGRFLGELSDPMPVRASRDGVLEICVP
jgi:beta-fructofuranosidase